MSVIPTAIISDGGNPKEVASFFHNVLFDVFTISDPEGKPCDTGSFLIALKEAKKRSPNSPMIIVKDTSTSFYSPEDIATSIKNTSADLVYLTRWGDRCDLSTHNSTIALRNTSIQTVNIHAPRGYQAIMISPKLRDALRKTKFTDTVENTLYNLVHSGRVSALGYTPNLFSYNTKYVKDMTDYYRSNLCTIVTPPVDSTTKQITVETYIYLTIIVGFFILIAYGLYLLGPAKKENISEKSSSSLLFDQDSYNTST